jgi:phosphatidylserine decarboxylase
MTRIHKEGNATLLVVFMALLVINGVFYAAHFPAWLMVILVLLSVGFFLFIVSFFRHPLRETKGLDGEVIAPADGKVVVIEEVMEEEFFHAKRKQISIFMSPANVHVNRSPISGSVQYVKYHPGKYLVAWHPKSSTENERTTIVIGNERYTVLVRQIAGILARRIVNYLRVNDVVKEGQEFGFIKFGSRVDVFLPLNAEVLVTLNQIVRGGETVIARC